MRRLPILIGLVAVIVVVGLSSVFIVDERKQALVLQFGQVKQVVTEPGLGMKIPFIQNVAYYEDRILPLETSELEVTPADERRLVVDAFARWRITDVVQFRQAVQFEAAAVPRLQRILNASLREVLGSVRSADVLSPERTVLMARIRDSARNEARALGVEIIDVRIRRADLPQQNLAATFNRMNAEREREARDERARGNERAQEVQATADRQAIELVSDAQRQSDIIRGQADAERNRIFAEAFGRDQEFFAFYRSLTAYERALRGSNSMLVISPDSEFFEYLKTDRLEGALVTQPGEFAPQGATGGAGSGAPAGDGGAAAPVEVQPEQQAETTGQNAAPAPAVDGTAPAANDDSAPTGSDAGTTTGTAPAVTPTTGSDQ